MEEKKGIKFSLTTIILISLIFILIVVFGAVKYYNDTSNLNDREDTNQQEDANNNIENKGNEETEEIFIDYSKDTTIVEDGYGEKVTSSNTINYALLRKYGYNEEVFKKYYSKGIATGDSPNYEIIESNYENNTGKYIEPITYNMAMVKDYLYQDNGNTLANNLNSFKQLLIKERNDSNNESELYVSLNGLSIMNGNNESIEDYKNNARAKKIQVTINDTSKFTFELKDTNEVQLFDLNYKQADIGMPIKVTIEVLEKYTGLVSDDIYINEIGFGLEQNGFGGI